MSEITAKVTLANKVPQGVGQSWESATLTFGADYIDGRNKRWAKATPYLNLVMVVKTEVAEAFQPGTSYTLTFTPEA